MRKISNKELRDLIKETVVGPDDLLKNSTVMPKKRNKLTKASLRSLIKEELEEQEQIPLSSRPGGAQFGISYKHVEAMAEFDPKHIDNIVTEFEKTMLDFLENSPDAFADPKTGEYGPFSGKDSKAKTDRTKAVWEEQVRLATDELRGRLDEAAAEFKKNLGSIINQVEDGLHGGNYHPGS